MGKALGAMAVLCCHQFAAAIAILCTMDVRMVVVRKAQ